MNKIISKFNLNLLSLILYFVSINTVLGLDLSSLKGGTQNKYPTVEQAFTFNAFIKNETQIQLLISAIPDTYVYQNSFQFATDNNKITLLDPQYPPAKTIVDEHYGKTPIFSDNVEIILPYQSNKQQNFKLKIQFQGCLKNVLCYPPKDLEYNLTALASNPNATPTAQSLPVAVAIAKPITVVQDQDKAVELLNSAKLLSIIGGFILFGLLLSLTPCVLPMLPIISGIIAGHKRHITKWHAFMLSFVYVLAMSLTYMVAGILVAMAGVNLVSSLQHPAVILTISALFIFLAIASFGVVELKLPNFIVQKLSNAQHHQKGGSYLGVATMGVLSALVISPCATAPLSGALLYISSTGNAWLGGIALFSMGFAMGLPILLFGTSAGHWLPKAGPWMKEINIFFGVTFLGLAIFLCSRIISGPLTLILSALVLIFYAVHLGLLEPAQHGRQRIQKGFALIMAIYGGFLLAGATQNQSDILHPFGLNNLCNTTVVAENTTTNTNRELEFTKIKDLTALQNNLEQSKNNQQITILDFYADWCVSCRNIEKNVFTDPKINKILTKFNRLKVDLTHYSDSDKKLMSKLSVFNPPTIIFYDKDGNEIKNSRIIGEITPENFYALLEKIVLLKISSNN